MLKILYLLLAFSGFCCFMYGVRHIFLEVESNACRMTYMFRSPQFMRLPTDPKMHPNYGLYYYYEGPPISHPRNIKFNGAPVIFVHGNAGSYKQVRSLASVALQKSLDLNNRLQLNYFAIDFNEELTGLHGGYLQQQQLFLQQCVDAVLRIYKNSKKVVLVGHSMGGKVAQSLLLQNSSLAQMVNSMIFISTPLDRPVVNFDASMAHYYRETNSFLAEQRLMVENDVAANCCSNKKYKMLTLEASADTDKEKILLLSIGGGNRDLLVNDANTASIFSDVHAMTSSIPAVWLSCDHLAAVWCLQLILVINRFLFNILTENSSFLNDSDARSKLAEHHFGYANHHGNSFMETSNDFTATWEQDEREFYTKVFEAKRKRSLHQIVPLENVKQSFYAELTSLDYYDWIYACDVVKINYLNATRRNCESGASLTHMAHKIPATASGQKRMFITLKLSKLRKMQKNWTHIVMRIPPNAKQSKLHVDIHDSRERILVVHTKNWLIGHPFYQSAIAQTKAGSAYFKLLFPGLKESYLALRIYVKPLNCSTSIYPSTEDITAKACIPWARGFEHYHQHQHGLSFLLSAPFSAPSHFNTTAHPAQVELYLNPECSYSISYHISFGGTMARIVRQFFQYLPAHITAIMLLALKQHMTIPLNSFGNLKNSLGFYSFLSAFLQPKASLALAAVSGAFYQLILYITILPRPDNLSHSFLAVVVIHSAALCCVLLLAIFAWLSILILNLFARQLGFWDRFSSLYTNLLDTLGNVFSCSLAVVLIAIAFYGSGGLALMLACLICFNKTAKLYETARQYLIAKNDCDYDTADSEQYSTNFVNIPLQLSLFLLVLLLTLLNLPATIAYIKGWHTNLIHSQPPDHTLVPFLILLFCLTISWKVKSSTIKCGHTITGYVLQACVCLCIIYCQESVYRLSYIIVFVFVISLLEQLISSTLL